MKRWAWLLLVAGMAAPGCVTVPNNQIEEPPVPPVEKSDLAPRPAVPPVMPEQVTDDNYHETFQRLSDEVERERNATPPGGEASGRKAE